MFEILLKSTPKGTGPGLHPGSQGPNYPDPAFSYLVGNAAMCIIGNDIFLSGGNTTVGAAQSTMAKFDTSTNTWTKLTDIPALIGPSRYHGMFAINGLIYLVSNKSNLGIYTPETNTWTTRTITGAPTFLLGSGFGCNENYIYQVAGGSSSRAVLQYNVLTGACITLPNIPIGRSFGSAVCTNGKLYAMAANVSDTLDELFVLDLSNPISWVTTGLKTPLGNRTILTAYHDSIYGLGGFNGGPSTVLPEVYEYATMDGSTGVSGVQSNPRMLTTAAMDNVGKIWQYGGQKTGGGAMLGSLTVWNTGWS